jgi:hypothetical protein
VREVRLGNELRTLRGSKELILSSLLNTLYVEYIL